MRPHAKELLFVLATATAVGLVGALVYPYSSAAETHRHLKLAEEFARTLVPILEKDSRFESVRVSQAIEGGASLIVQGWVETKADLAALHVTIENSSPPVKVRWAVRTYDGPDPAADKMPM